MNKNSFIIGIVVGLIIVAVHRAIDFYMSDKDNNAVKNNAKITKMFCVSGNLVGVIDTGDDNYMLYLRDCYNRRIISCRMNGNDVEYKKDRMCLDMP